MGTKGYEHMTLTEAAALGRQRVTMSQKRRSKYGATRTEAHGLTFDSAKEARRYQELLNLGRAGAIRKLMTQIPISLVVNSIVVGSYVPDFQYDELIDGRWVPVFEDVKSVATARKDVYRLKKKLVAAIYGIQIREV